MTSKAGSITKASGIAWPDWDAWLLNEGALNLSHPDIAKLALSRIHELNITTHQVTGKPFNDGWWAQSISIEFEHQHGLREQGQSAAGGHAVSTSKKVVGSLDELLDGWLAVATSQADFDGVEAQGEPRVSSTEKWRYWRIALVDGSAVNVDISSNKIAVQHAKLASNDHGERWRVFWRTRLEEVKIGG